MSDPLDDYEAELEDVSIPDALIIRCDSENEIVIETPGEELSEDRRIAMLVRALIVELAEDIVAALEGIEKEEDG